MLLALRLLPRSGHFVVSESAEGNAQAPTDDVALGSHILVRLAADQLDQPFVGV
jgi:hypothetical protein